MAELHDILRRPLINEKSSRLQESDNVYAFEVSETANKHEIKSAVETAFGVTVVDVRTLRMRGKAKRFGQFMGKRSNWKKAYVRLAEGSVLNFFES